MAQDERNLRADAPALALLLANLAAAAALVWMRCFDPAVDYGRELYIPWRLAAGEGLYREIQSLYGPLSAVLHALLFRAGGLSAALVTGTNLALAAGSVFLLYFYVRSWCGRVPALAAGVGFIHLFACANFGPTGNYNFLMPYSHEAVHGFHLLVLMVVLLAPRRGEPGAGRLAAAGVAFFLRMLSSGWKGAGGLAPFSAGAVLAAGLFCLASRAAGIDAGTPWQMLSGSWRLVLVAPAGEIAWYDQIAGFDRPLVHLGRTALHVAALAALLGGLMGATRPGGGRRALWGGVLLALAGMAAWVDVRGVSRAFPVLVLAVAAVAAWRMARARFRDGAGERAFLVAAAAALALQLKVALNSGIYHYGFYLTAPCFLLLPVAAAHVLRTWREHAGGTAARRAGLAWTGVLGLFTAFHVMVSLDSTLARTARLEDGTGNRLAYAPDRDMGAWTDAAARWARARVAEGETLAVLPQGVLVNVLARRVNPSPHLHVLLPEVVLFGKDAVLRSYQEEPPDWIILLPAHPGDTGDSDAGMGGYLPELPAWVRAAYEPAGRIGVEGTDAFATCWRRRDGSTMAPL